MLPSADPAAQLMQLRQPEAVSIHDDHQRGIRDIDTNLYDRCRHQKLQFVAVKFRITSSFSDGVILP